MIRGENSGHAERGALGLTHQERYTADSFIWRAQIKRLKSTFTAAVIGTASNAPTNPPNTNDQNNIEKITVNG